MLGKPGSEIRVECYERAIRWFEGVAKGPNINPCIRQNLTFADSVALFLRASSLFSPPANVLFDERQCGSPAYYMGCSKSN